MLNRILAFAAAAVLVSGAPAVAQRSRAIAPAKPRPVVFAVLNDGKIAEPIGYVEKGTLSTAVDGGSEAAQLKPFARTYYMPGASYQLVFGGSNAGTLAVKSSDTSAECTKHTAEVSYTSQKARLRGNVMALATNLPSAKGSGVRRMPTAAERAEIESLVRSEMVRQKVSAEDAKDLKYHNLTALDVDSDGSAEMVGTFWVDVGPTSRALLFFIAGKTGDGKYASGFTDFRIIDQKDVMSGEISAVDQGTYHERLLDVLDINNDGVAEVFTYIASFEGAGFNVYRRNAGKWTSIFEGSNYHCGY